MRDTTTSEFTDEGTNRNGPKVFSNKKVALFITFSIICSAGIIGLVYSLKLSINNKMLRHSYLGFSIEEILKRPNLPKDIIPQYYRLYIEPDFNGNGTYSGQVTISLECKRPTKRIVLHSANLTISNVEIKTVVRYAKVINVTNVDGTKEIRVNDFLNKKINVSERYEGHSKVVVELAEVLAKGERYFLRIDFSGGDYGGDVGFVQKEGREIFIYTNTQPIYARNLFPCFDEFGFDAHFEISLAKRTNMVALSNTCLKDSEMSDKHPGIVWNHFETTPLMPARQVSFAIAEMKGADVPTKTAGVVVKIWSQHPNQFNKHITKITSDILTFFTNYFNTDYPLEKLDLVLVPHLSEAVQGHLGLIFLREDLFLLNSANGAFNSVARVVVQQWLDAMFAADRGSLMLHRGLNTYLSYISETALVHPSALDNFDLEIMQPSLIEEASTVGGFNLSNKINDRNALNMYDEQVGNKIASVFRMIGGVFGEDIFREELMRIIEESNHHSVSNNFGNPDTDFEKVMRSFLSLTGFPLVTATINEYTCVLKIEQRVFGTFVDNFGKWIIPINYALKGNGNSEYSVFLEQSRTKINLKCSNNSWILLNINRNVYYRVNYDARNWNALINQLTKDNLNEIPLSNRIQLIYDAFELANYGYLEYETPFKLLSYLENESHRAPWKAALDSLGWIEDIVAETLHFGIYKNYTLHLLEAHEVSYNFSNPDPINILKMNKICAMGYKLCTTKALQIFDEFYSNSTQNLIALPELKYTIYCLAVESGPEEYWDFIWELSKNATGFEKEIIFLALGCSRETWRLSSYLERTLNEEISSEYVKTVWKSLSKNPVGKIIGMNLVENRWDDIYESYKNKPNLISAIIVEFVNSLTTEMDSKKVADFYNKHRADLKPMSELIKNALMRIKLKVSWKEKHFNAVLALLSEYSKNTPFET